MFILFIADVHLSSKKPNIVNGFLNFLRYQATKARALYILGDLFEVWLGDDCLNTLHIDIATGLRVLQEKKIPCYFIHGNRDFLLSKKYANSCGMILLPKHQIIKLSSNTNIIILHGNSLCINDTSFMKFQKILNFYFLQKIFLLLPLFVRLYIFNILNIYASKYKRYKSKKQLKVDETFIIKMMIENQSKIMIHGHTHQPKIHEIHYSKHIILKRIVLGCWDDYGGSVVQINEKDHTISLKRFIFQEKNQI